MKLIDKDTLVTEIKRLYQEHSSKEYIDEAGCVLYKLEDFLDTLEVKEVDLGKEINDSIPSKYCWSGDGEAVYTKEQMVEFAKHFFELGMQVSSKAQKGEEYDRQRKRRILGT